MTDLGETILDADGYSKETEDKVAQVLSVTEDTTEPMVSYTVQAESQSSKSDILTTQITTNRSFPLKRSVAPEKIKNPAGRATNSRNKKFDLQESLKRPLTYKPHTGKLPC